MKFKIEGEIDLDDKWLDTINHPEVDVPIIFRNELEKLKLVLEVLELSVEPILED